MHSQNAQNSYIFLHTEFPTKALLPLAMGPPKDTLALEPP